MENQNLKTLGQAIDDIVLALKDLDDNTKSIVLKAVVDHLKIPIYSVATQQLAINNSTPNALDLKLPENGNSGPVQMDIKTLKENKNPKNAIEMACIVAYYLKNEASVDERQDDISKAELEKYFIQAKFPLPKVIQQVLVDAKTSGYFDSAGRGRYKLNPVGHNLVAHKLPLPKK